MKIYSMVEERSKLVKEIGKRLDVKPEYQGAPTFAYKVGPYTVLKDGSIEVEDVAANLDFLRELHAAGFIDDSWNAEHEVLEIKVPMTGHTGRSLVNLVHIFFCRGELINKAIGCSGAFKINERFLESLDENLPETPEEFLKLLEQRGGNEVNSGLEFTTEAVNFFGFPLTEDADAIKAYIDLSGLINQMALTQKRVQIEKPDTTNEKYSFRVWLLRLGMKGENYKGTRRVLLKNLPGHSAFRTRDQAEVAKEKNKEKRVVAEEE